MDPTRIEAFAAQVVSDLAAAMGSAMTSLGGKLGFYQALAAAPRTRPGIDSAGVTLGMIRFVLMMGGAAAAVAVWATALLASLQRVMWPLAVAVVTLAGSALAFAFS